MAEFKIGTTLVGMTALESLTTPVDLPQWEYYPYARLVTLGSGGTRGIGLPKVVWTFPILDVDQISQLRTFCSGASAQVYIRTKIQDGTYADFLADMIWPVSKDGQHKPSFPDHRSGLVIEFRNMVEQ